jgi:AraC family ethanolamine operon transcriptional activator
MGENQATHVSKTRMNTLFNREVFDWNLIADQQFQNLEEFSNAIEGWDFELHQLTPGKSSIELLQLGRPEFMISRFHFEQSYHQSGGAPTDSLSFGLCEEGVDGTTTPDDIIHQNSIFCFPSNHEMTATLPPHFKGHTLSISEALFAEAGESCGLQEASSCLGMSQQVLHSDRSQMNEIRQVLRRTCQDLAFIKRTADKTEIIQNLEFDIIRHLLQVLAGSRPADKLRLTGRKQIVLQRAREYVEENTNKSITVLELAKASGASVRMLEYVFQDCFDVTPKIYLKSRRLVGTYREFLRSSPLSTTVGEIASRWGFWHMSQFACDYSRFFSELPSETLNRARIP